MPDPLAALRPIETAVEHLAEIRLNFDRAEKTRNGLPTRVAIGNYTGGEFVRMTDENRKIVAIGSFDPIENVIQPKVVLG